MPANGFIGFITSQGFFIGLIFAVLKYDDPIAMLVVTLLTTGVFYVFAQISVSYFVRYNEVGLGHFPTKEHELMLDQFFDEIVRREELYEQNNFKRRKNPLEEQILKQAGDEDAS